MLKLLFYSIGLLLVAQELMKIFNINNYVKKNKHNVSKLKKLQNLKTVFDEYDEPIKSWLWGKLYYFTIFLIFVLGGLFTFNWFGHLLFLTYWLIFLLISKKFQYSKILLTIDSIITVIFVISMIINSYHLKIDLLEIWRGLF